MMSSIQRRIKLPLPGYKFITSGRFVIPGLESKKDMIFSCYNNDAYEAM
jgi:hypothetical protein